MRTSVKAMQAICVAAVVLVAAPSWAASKNLKIAMVLWRGETPAEQGFKEGLARRGYAAGYVVVNGEQDRTLLRSRLETAILPQLDVFDYIYSFGTTATRMTKDLIRGRVPQIFNIVTDPVKAGIVSSWERPGGNISGVSQVVPLSMQIRAALELIDVSSLGLLFNPREENAMIQRANLKRIAKEVGFEVVDLKSPPALDMLEQNLERLANRSVKVDAVYLPFDSFLISNAELIGTKLREARIKSIGATERFVVAGALMGLVPDYRKLGDTAAVLLHRHHAGENLGQVPVQQVYRTEKPALMINARTHTALDVRLPEGALAQAVIVD